MKLRQKLRALCISAVGFVVMADVLFYGQDCVGIGAAVFGGCFLAVLMIRSTKMLTRKPAIVLLAGTMAMVLLLVEQPGPLRITLAIVFLGSLAIGHRCGWRSEPGIWLERWSRVLLFSVPLSLCDFCTVARWRRRFGSGSQFLRWMLPALLTSVFVFLFWLANPLVERALHATWEWVAAAISRDICPEPARILFWFLALVTVWSFLRIRRRHERPARATPPPLPVNPSMTERETPFVIRTLLLCNLVFLVQNGMDSGFLWTGMQLPTGMTYAQYAHRGAYPLIATALLAAAFVLWSFRPNGPAWRNRQARFLVYVWLGQNVFLTVSSLLRLKLYVDIYCLSRLRVAAAVWMLLVAAGLVLIVWRISGQRSNQWLIKANVVSLAVTLFLCSCVNFERIISHWNVDIEFSEQRQVNLDLDYLCELGPDSLPALRRLQQGRPSAEVDFAIRELERKVDGQLGDWRGWSLRRHLLFRASMEAHEEELSRTSPSE